MCPAVRVASPGVTRRWITPNLAAGARTAMAASPEPATSAGRRIRRAAPAGGSTAVVLVPEGADCVVVMA